MLLAMRRRLGDARRWLLLGVALVALALPARAAAATTEEPPEPLPFQMVLRLPELAPGYKIDEGGCGFSDVEGRAPKLKEWFRKYRPKACMFRYERRFRVSGHGPNPPLVNVFILTTPSAEAAQAAVAFAPELFRWVLLDGEMWPFARRIPRIQHFERGAAPFTIGEETWLFRTEDQLVFGRDHPGSVIVWRIGGLLAGVEVAGWPHVADERVAAYLVPLQQHHIDAPTPYTDAELDHSEVALDNPRLRIPIYWLGSRFAPGHGLDTLHLEEAVTGKETGPPGEEAELWYHFGVSLSSWSAAEWRRVASSFDYGPAVLARRKCTETTRIELPSGFAVILGTYGRDFEVCPDTGPTRYQALAHLGRTVVGVNLELCNRCLGPGLLSSYNSVRGMKTVLRGLRIRPRASY